MGHRLLEKITTLFFDAVAINAAFWLSFWLRFYSGFFPESVNYEKFPEEYILPSILLTLFWLLGYFFTGLYRSWYKESRLDEFFVVARTILVGLGLFLLMLVGDQLYLFFIEQKLPSIPKEASAALWIYGTTLLVSATFIRFFLHSLYAWLYSKGVANQKMAIVGANPAGLKLAQEIACYPRLGYHFVGFIDDGDLVEYEGFPVLGKVADIPTLSHEKCFSSLVISHVSNAARDVLSVLNYCWDENLTIYLEPTLVDVVSGHLKTNQVAGVPLIVLLQDHMPHWEAQIKRLFDISVSLLLFPLFLLLWLMVKVIMHFVDPGPAIYTQERVGQNGKPFTMMKFRSMYIDAESRSGPQWATANDPRITPLGRFMRKARIDEIPQVINVLRGEMSFVGPRPERQYFIDKLSIEIPWYVKRLKMKPGVTGWAQVKHKYDETIDDVKTKVMYDLYYFENMSLALDLKIILLTILVVFTGKGAK